MHPRRKPSLALLALISALAALPVHGVLSEPRLLAQGPREPTPTFTQPQNIAPETTLRIEGSPSMAGINQSLKESFEQRYSGATVTVTTSSDDQALAALRAGTVDLAALGRALSEAEDDPSFTSIPVTREKIAIIVGRDNPFRGDLTFGDFAAIFRGEITNWSEVGGPNVPIRFVDRPATSDTRLALADYEIFKAQPFETGANAVTVEADDTAAVVRALGSDGISYAIASEVIGQDAVRPLSMHNTMPDDPRYPYSQPRNYIYRGEPSLAIEAFLGFATNADGQAAIAEAKQAASANVTVGANRLPGGVALSPDGQFMVRGSEDGRLEWLDAQGRPTATVAGAHRGAVATVVISPDGQTVISSGADGTLRRWDRNGAPLGEPMVGPQSPVLALAVSPEGTLLASGHADGTVQRWSVADGAPLGDPIAAHSGPVQALHFPAGGQVLLSGSGDGGLRLWNVDGTPSGQVDNTHNNGITAIASSPDGQVLTTTGGDGTVRQWTLATLQPRGDTIRAHGSSISAVAYAPDGDTLATAGTDSTLQLWSSDGNPRLSDPVVLNEPAASLGFTPDGQLVVGTSGRRVELRASDGTLETATAPAPATDLGNLRDRLRNLPPSAWWTLGAIPLLLLVAGVIGSMLGIKGKESDTDDLESVPNPGAGIDFSGVGKQPVPPESLSPEPLPPEPQPSGENPWPPEAGLVVGGDYEGGSTISRLEQARIDLAEGRRLMREGRYDTALIYFNRAVEATEVERSRAEATGVPALGLNAIAAQAQAQRGHALALLGQANDAMDSYNAALQNDASVTEAWIGKGRLLSTMGRYDEAIFCFDSALERDPSAGEAWLGKGQALVQLGRHSEAQTCFAQASALGLAVPGLGIPSEAPAPAYPEGPGISPSPVDPVPPVAGALPEPAPWPAYDPDVPLELQQMVMGLPSADVEILGGTVGSDGVPSALAAEAARLPSQAETAVGRPYPSGTGVAITPGPIPADQVAAPGLMPPGPIPPDSAPPAGGTAITPGPILPDTSASGGTAITPGPIPPSPLEDELLSQVHLGAASALDIALQQLPSDTEMPPSAPVSRPRPAPVPVPPPVPLEPGDYVPPPPEVSAVANTTDAAAPGTEAPDLEGLPPEVVAALASIPPSSPDSFGVVSTGAAPAAAPPATKSWVRLSIDPEGERFYALWQIDEGDRTQTKAAGGETLALRLYDVTGQPTTAPLPPAVVEQRCRDDFAQDWYLSIPQWDRIYVVEVGYLSEAGDWQAIAQSSEVAAITPA